MQAQSRLDRLFDSAHLPRLFGDLQLPGQPGRAAKRVVQPVEPAHPVFRLLLHAGAVRRVLRLAVAAGAHRPQLEHRHDRTGAAARPFPGQMDSGRRCRGVGPAVHRGAVYRQWSAGGALPLQPAGALALVTVRRDWRRHRLHRPALFEPCPVQCRPVSRQCPCLPRPAPVWSCRIG